jgi:UDP-glucose 4-epimerase
MPRKPVAAAARSKEGSMRVVILGGSGFVGLNIGERLARAGHEVVALDRQPPPPAVVEALGDAASSIRFAIADVTRPNSLAEEIRPGTDALICGAAITADAARDAAEPERVLAVNLVGFVAALRAARDARVGRIVNLSSGAAVGLPAGVELFEEACTTDPASLYAISKFASERVAARLAALWSLDVVSVRLSSVFGPLEYATGVRDTLSPMGQIMMAATHGRPALLPRPGFRDWVYAPDVAEAVAQVLAHSKLGHRLYNIAPDTAWSALAFGEALAVLRPGFVCRLAQPDEAATIDLFADVDRPRLPPERIATDVGWRARYGMTAALADFDGWAGRHGERVWGREP